MPFEFLGNSHCAEKIRETVEVAIKSDFTVLLCGETGTGKELLARAIHAESPRKSAAFATVNCSSLPEELVENEFFGHEQGAFTGAVCRSRGLCQAADGGTLFLDEIGDMSLNNQPPLLRFLNCPVNKREVRPIGGIVTTHLNVRVIAATNKDIEAMVSLRTFREDLYYRLNVIRINLPPLRERREDMAFFLRLFQSEHGVAISTKALDHLNEYDWPGNFRELFHVLEIAAFRARLRMQKKHGAVANGKMAVILPEDIQLPKTAMLPRLLPNFGGDFSLPDHMNRMEKELIETAIRHVSEEGRWKWVDVARCLGISRITLYRRLRAHHITRGYPVCDTTQETAARAAAQA